jgi:hypothetical protein
VELASLCAAYHHASKHDRLGETQSLWEAGNALLAGIFDANNLDPFT